MRMDNICFSTSDSKTHTFMKIFRLHITMSSPVFFLLSYSSITKTTHIHIHNRKGSVWFFISILVSSEIQSLSHTKSSHSFQPYWMSQRLQLYALEISSYLITLGKELRIMLISSSSVFMSRL